VAPRHPLAERTWSGAALVATSALLFAFNGVVSKTALQAGLGSTHLVLLRTVGAALVLFALAAAVSRPALRATPRELAVLAVLGVVGVALVQWLYFVAIGRLHVGVGLLLEFTAPLMVALWARFVLGETVRGRVWLALVLSLIGLTMVAQIGRGVSLDAVGVAAGLGAAVALATYYLLGERLLHGRDAWSTMSWSMGFAGLFWLLLGRPWTLDGALLTSPVDVPGTSVQAPLWLFVAWVVLLGTVAPYACVVLGLSRVGAARAGLIGTVEPVLASAFAWALLSEVMTPLQVLGGIVVLVGVLLAESARTARRARRQVAD
jgi:Predicted permease, DMT superfamily